MTTYEEMLCKCGHTMQVHMFKGKNDEICFERVGKSRCSCRNFVDLDSSTTAAVFAALPG